MVDAKTAKMITSMTVANEIISEVKEIEDKIIFNAARGYTGVWVEYKNSAQYKYIKKYFKANGYKIYHCCDDYSNEIGVCW